MSVYLEIKYRLFRFVYTSDRLPGQTREFLYRQKLSVTVIINIINAEVI